MAVEEEAPGRGRVTLAYPALNFAEEEEGLGTSLWMALVGGYAPTAARFERSVLTDIELPPSVERRLPGPRFGRAGMRRLLGQPPGGVVVGAIVKPVSGITPEEVARDAERAARAGVAFLKDDQKMLNPAYCPLLPRIRAVEEALARVADETSHLALYAPHLTARADRIVAQAERAVAAGARALTVTFLPSGAAGAPPSARGVGPRCARSLLGRAAAGGAGVPRRVR